MNQDNTIDRGRLAAQEPESPIVTLGVIPLVDAAPLIAATYKGFSRRHKLDIRISLENSWSAIRDKVTLGKLDGAHMLAPMPMATRLGLGHIRMPMIVPMALSLNGNAVTLSVDLVNRMEARDTWVMSKSPLEKAQVLAAVVRELTRQRGEPPTLAMVFPFSSHNYELRYWLASGGLDPDRDVRLIVVPPPLVAANLAAGLIDGFCVGEPWNSLAAEKGDGRIVVRKSELFPFGLEKVLAVTERWAALHPATLGALIRTIVDAAHWCDQPENRDEVAEILSVSGVVNAPKRLLRQILARPGHEGGFCFSASAANFPWLSQAGWILAQMVRWGQVSMPADARALCAQTFRPDLYRAALSGSAAPVPDADEKIEGAARKSYVLASNGGTGELTMGADAAFDTRSFALDRFDDYLTSLS